MGNADLLELSQNYSVLMTVYKKDNPQYFMASVTSMMNQTIKTDDFVVVCDGSLTAELDNCIKSMVSEYEEIFHIIRLPKNVGLGKALSIGLAACKNELVARMDDDDVAHRDRCEKQLRFYRTHQNVSILGSYVSEFEDTPDRPVRIKKVPCKQEEILKYSRKRNPFCHSTVMIRRDDVIAAGNYSDMRTNQDVELWVRMLHKGFRGANMSEILVDFRFDTSAYKRRKDWNNVKLMLHVWHGFFKKGYCKLEDYIFVIISQMVIYFMPERVVRWLYDHFR